MLEGEFPKFLFLGDTPDNALLVADADEESAAREKGFREVWGSSDDSSDPDGEKESLKKKLRDAGVSFGGNSGVEKLRALVAEKGL